MSRFSSFLAAGFVVFSLLFISQPVNAALSFYDGAWKIADNNQNAFILDSSFGFVEFGIYDFANPDSHYSLAIAGQFVEMFAIHSGELYQNNVATGFIFSDPSEAFGFYFGAWDSSDKDYLMSGIENNWSLYFSDVGTPISPGFISFSVLNANPVPVQSPIPSALLLLGSGLVGLVGFKRKIKR